MESEAFQDLSQNRMPDLPIREELDDVTSSNYWTTIVWEPMEHFIHAPKDHSLKDYHLTKEQLKRVNWPALRVAWQRHLKRLYEIEGQYLEKGNYISRIGWDEDKEEAGENHIYHDWEPQEAVEEYDESRIEDPNAVKEDYIWLRNEILTKLGEYNDFGMPDDLYK